MNISNTNGLRWITAFLLGAATSTPALAGFTNPYTPPYRGMPDTEFSGWESFTSAYQGANAPDVAGSTSDDALIFQTTSGAFLSAGNIYSFSAATTFVLHDVLPGDLQDVALQTSTHGSELAYANVRLRYVDGGGAPHDVPFSSYTQLAYTPGMGVSVESLFEWNLSAVADHVTTFELHFDAAAPSMSLDAVLLDVRWTASPSPSIYCTSQVNSQGCTPAIGFAGVASASTGSGFSITAAQILDHKAGLFVYSTAGAASIAYHGGTLCTAAPRLRTLVQNSNGSSSCTGSYAFDFNAWIASSGNPALVNGAQVWGQYWSRDPNASPFHSNLTDALTFVVGP